MMGGGILNIQQERLCVNEFFVYTWHQHGLTDLKSEQSFSTSLFLVLLYFLLKVKNNLQNGGMVKSSFY